MSQVHPDTISRFLFESADIRGEIVHLDSCYQTIINQHAYPDCLKKLLGEALAATVLMNATIKYEGGLTLQFQSNGALSLLLVKCDHKQCIRALIQFDEQADNEAYLQSLAQGKLVITIESDKHVRPYQSIVPVKNACISDSLEFYFAQSEQLATKIWLAANEKKVSGMLLQMLPSNQKIEDRESFWSYATMLGSTITGEELLELDNQTILNRLYHEETLRLYAPQPVRFFCPCSKERMSRAIQTLGEKEALQALKEQEKINVSCEFCGQHFVFDAIDIEMIFREP